MSVTLDVLRFTRTTPNSNVAAAPVLIAVPAGNRLVVLINAPVTSAITSWAVTDSKGNTYAVHASQNATPTNYQMAIASAVITTPLTTSDTVTVTATGANPAKWVVMGASADDAVSFSVTGSASGSSSSPSVTSDSAPGGPQLVIGGIGWTDTTSVTLTPAGGATGNAKATATDRSLEMLYRYDNTTAGGRTLNGGLSSGQAWGALVAVFTPSNIAPTVTDNRGNQNVGAGTTATLDFLASDADGTIASRTTTFDYPTTGAPTITGGNTSSPSFPVGAAGSLYVVRHTVTDNNGATASVTTEVRVPSNATLVPLPVTGSGVGTWSTVGGASSGGAALADGDNATYVESGAATTAEQNRRWRLQPSVVRTSGTIALVVSQDLSGTIIAKARLYEGNTLRQEWTVPTTTTPTTQNLTLSAGTVSAITDWGNLYIEVAVTG